MPHTPRLLVLPLTKPCPTPLSTLNPARASNFNHINLDANLRLTPACSDFCSPGDTLESAIAGRQVCAASTLPDNAPVSQSGRGDLLHQPRPLHSLPLLVPVGLLLFASLAYGSLYLTVFLTCFSLIINEVGHILTYLLLSLYIQISSSIKGLCKSFAHFLLLIDTILLNFRISVIKLAQMEASVFSQFVVCISTSLGCP